MAALVAWAALVSGVALTQFDPTSLDELSGVWGFGGSGVRLQKYGEYFLDVRPPTRLASSPRPPAAPAAPGASQGQGHRARAPAAAPPGGCARSSL